MSEDCTSADLLGLLDDECARTILTNTSREPMSAQTLDAECEASRPTIYRRLNDLLDCGLVEKRTEPAPDGNHYARYAATVERIEVFVEENGIEVELGDYEDHAADRFTDVWHGMRGEE